MMEKNPPESSIAMLHVDSAPVEGQLDSSGYMVRAVIPRAAQGPEVRAMKDVGATFIVKTTRYPGAYDKLLGEPEAITSSWRVWVCQEMAGEDAHDAPPEDVALPRGATRWDSREHDGILDWRAVFDTEALAEAYAESLPVDHHEAEPIERRHSFTPASPGQS